MENKKIFAFFSLLLVSFPLLVLADSFTVTNPLPYSTVKDLLGHIKDGVSAVIGAISTVMLLVAGGLFLFSHGEPEKLATAKKAVLYAIIGIVVVIAAQAIIDTILWIATGSAS